MPLGNGSLSTSGVPGPATGPAAVAGGAATTVVTVACGALVGGAVFGTAVVGSGLVGATVTGAAVVGAAVGGATVGTIVGVAATVTVGATDTDGIAPGTEEVSGVNVFCVVPILPPRCRAIRAKALTRQRIKRMMAKAAPRPTSTCGSSSIGKSMVGGIRGISAVRCRSASCTWICGSGAGATLVTAGCSTVGSNADVVAAAAGLGTVFSSR